MRGLLLLLTMGCHCGESAPLSTDGPSPAAQKTLHTVQARPMADAEPTPAADRSGLVQILESGELHYQGELLPDESMLRTRLAAARLPEDEALELEAHPAIPWSDVRPVLAVMAEPPGPGVPS